MTSQPFTAHPKDNYADLVAQRDHLVPFVGAGLARSYGNQALILKAWGKLEEAMALHKQEQAINEELGNRAGLAISFWNQGGLLWKQDDRAGSLLLCRRSIAIWLELGIPCEDKQTWLAANVSEAEGDY